VLTAIGYTGDRQQLSINLGYACFQFAFALFGAALVERVGRRPLFLFSMSACTIVWVGMTIASSQFVESDKKNSSAGQACLAMIFMFGMVYSIGITPLQALYPVEVLSYEMRAKGMGFSGLAVSIGGLLGQFAWPISLKNIG
jgi:MFS family permease